MKLRICKLDGSGTKMEEVDLEGSIFVEIRTESGAFCFVERIGGRLEIRTKSGGIMIQPQTSNVVVLEEKKWFPDS